MKVIFIIFSIAIYVFSFIVPIGYIDGIRTYNPDQIRHFSEQIIAQKEWKDIAKTKFFMHISEYLPAKKYSRGEIANFFKKIDVTDGWEARLYLNMLLALDKDIEWLSYDEDRCYNDCGASNKWIYQMYVENYICKYDYKDESGFMHYCDEIEYWVMLPTEDILMLKEAINFSKKIDEIVWKIQGGNPILSYENEKFLKDLGIKTEVINRDYIPNHQYIVAFGFWIISLIIITILLWTIRWITYFIILGKFTSEK